MSGLNELSVIVPLAPGENAWRTLLGDLTALPASSEVILVAAAGTPAPDDLVALAAALTPILVWCDAPRGRAAQQNAGAVAARHPLLWFLHADSRVGSQALIELARARPRLAGRLGYFDLAFAADGPPLMWLNAIGAKIRSRALGLPFGDQGLLLNRVDFERLGRFDPGVGWGEDHDLVWRAHRAGLRLLRIPATVTTSARKYAEQGWLRTTLRHLAGTWRQARTFSRTRVPK
ncbi:MAG: glycosyl transferase family 2 [Lysobacterales bacterium]